MSLIATIRKLLQSSTFTAPQSKQVGDAFALTDAAIDDLEAGTGFTDNVYPENVVVPSAQTYGIKVDREIPTWGWRDITGSIEVSGGGAADPTFATYTGTVLRAYRFSATIEQEVFMVFHLPHDYVVGTDIYFHAHWSNAAASPNTGDVVWGFDYTFAKGYNQQAFPALTGTSVVQACPATRYQHNIAETAAVTITGLEPDGLILCRIYRAATDGKDTCTDDVFMHNADVHYQSTNVATKNKNADFWT